MSSNNERFQHSFNSKSGKTYTIAWEEQHSSSFRVTFIGNSYFLMYDEDTRDPAITKIADLLEKEGYNLAMDHTVREPGSLVMYSLRFKKNSGEDTKVADLLHVVNVLTSRA